MVPSRYCVALFLAVFLGVIAICTVGDDATRIAGVIVPDTTTNANTENVVEKECDLQDLACKNEKAAAAAAAAAADDNNNALLLEEAIDTATKQLRSHIESLSSRLQDADSQYMALKNEKEASEQSFKVQINLLQTNLQDKERLYAKLETDKAEMERSSKEQMDSLKQELDKTQKLYESVKMEQDAVEQSLKKQIHALENRLNSSQQLEQTWDYALAQEREKLSTLANNMEVMTRESIFLKHQMSNVISENTRFSTAFHNREQDLLTVKNKLFDLRQELFESNQRRREMERKSNESIVRIAWDRLRASKECGFVIDQLEIGWKKLNLYILGPTWNYLNHFFQTIIVPNVRTITSSAGDMIQHYYDFIPSIEASLEIEFLKPITTSQIFRTYMHYRRIILAVVARWLKHCSSVVSSYCILQNGPNPSGWLYVTSQYIHVNCEKIAHGMELLLMLLLCDYVLRSILSLFQRSKLKQCEPTKT